MRTRAKGRVPNRHASKESNPRSKFEIEPRRSRAYTYICCFVLAVATIALYWPVMSHPFINYDDDHYVTDNPRVRAGLSAENIAWAFTSTDQANWHPLTWLSHELDCQIYGLDPRGQHFTSVLIHTANVLLLFLLLQRATGATGNSAMVAALFALHPLNVESVAWIAERKNVLSTFFFFLTLGAYGWYTRKPDWTRYGLVVTFFICGLMSKPMLVTLPFVLLLLDYWPLKRMNSTTALPKLLAEKLLLFFISFVSSVMTYRAQQAGEALRSATQFPFNVRIENAIVSYALYIWKAIWPFRLAPFYPYPALISWWKIVISICVLAAITYLCVAFRNEKYLLTGWLWFLGTLVPVIGFVQVGDQAMADRYAYLPLIGIFVMFTWSAASILQERRIAQPAVLILASAVLVPFLLNSSRQISFWSSSKQLWLHTLAVTSHNSLAHRQLGFALMLSNDRRDALEHFREAAAISPTDSTNYINLGLCLDANNQTNAAIEQYKKAISITSDATVLAPAYTNLGTDYVAIGDYPKAHESYDRALELNPGLFNAHFDRGLLLEREGKFEQAVLSYQRSVELVPTYEGYLQLSRALRRLNRIAEAQSSYEKAMTLASGQSPIRGVSAQP